MVAMIIILPRSAQRDVRLWRLGGFGAVDVTADLPKVCELLELGSGFRAKL